MNITVKQTLETNYNNVEMEIFEDADVEFVLALKNKNESIKYIFDEDKLVGYAQLIKGKNAFIYIFIIPEYRNKGLGANTLKLCEEMLYRNNAKKITTSYRIDNIQSRAFANKHGYVKKFSSAYMKYEGDRFDITEQSIRTYCDSDYNSAHEMYAKAFHEMRVSVGDFPDSTIEEPSENMRKYWAETADERLVYIHNDIIVGYSHIHGNEIGSISVRTQYQGQGIGRNFVKYICNKILEEGNDMVTLYCVIGNKARNLYDSLGFKELNTLDYAEKFIA